MTRTDKLTKEEKRLEDFSSFFGKKSGWKIEGSPVVNLTPVKETPVIEIGSPELRSDKPSLAVTPD